MAEASPGRSGSNDVRASKTMAGASTLAHKSCLLLPAIRATRGDDITDTTMVAVDVTFPKALAVRVT